MARGGKREGDSGISSGSKSGIFGFAVFVFVITFHCIDVPIASKFELFEQIFVPSLFNCWSGLGFRLSLKHKHILIVTSLISRG